jgi:putative ABC transport system permease protein
MARILGLCERLGLTRCPHLPQNEGKSSPAVDAVISHELTDLALRDQRSEAMRAARPSLDLLAATAAGAPNVVRVAVARADYQGFKEADDSFIWLILSLAPQLLYGSRRAQGQ